LCYSSQRQPYFSFLKVPSGILEPIEKGNKALRTLVCDRLLAVMFCQYLEVTKLDSALKIESITKEVDAIKFSSYNLRCELTELERLREYYLKRSRNKIVKPLEKI
jgi:hypothetical protein